jgi:dTDP-4-dehydrorhamnose 3,5-epimerase
MPAFQPAFGFQARDSMAPDAMIKGTKDEPIVAQDGRYLWQYIDGVHVRLATTHLDERGELCEVYNPDWGFSHEPLVYVYQATVRPGRVKGWVYHEHQDDRLFVSGGSLKIVLYDLREDSPTKGRINEIFLGDNRRGLVRIPKRVAHAVQNIGLDDASFINMPTRAYRHDNPDKYRISINSDQIPYRFDAVIDR